jgi:uncharacterized membrane protein YeaQ/YmgE (transglycosylase-associated protein family)
MQLNIDKKRWLGRQSSFTQVMVFAAVFFVASLVGVLVADSLFGDPSFGSGSPKEIAKFFSVKFIKALIGGAVVVILIRNNRKTNSK